MNYIDYMLYENMKAKNKDGKLKHFNYDKESILWMLHKRGYAVVVFPMLGTFTALVADALTACAITSASGVDEETALRNAFNKLYDAHPCNAAPREHMEKREQAIEAFGKLNS